MPTPKKTIRGLRKTPKGPVRLADRFKYATYLMTDGGWKQISGPSHAKDKTV
jgi:hypothetical protein